MSVFGNIIGVVTMFCVSASVLVPRCCSLRYFAASCALSLCCMCCPCAYLLWNGVGLYFLLGSLIPSHLSLMSSSLESDSIILVFCVFPTFYKLLIQL